MRRKLRLFKQWSHVKRRRLLSGFNLKSQKQTKKKRQTSYSNQQYGQCARKRGVFEHLSPQKTNYLFSFKAILLE